MVVQDPAAGHTAAAERGRRRSRLSAERGAVPIPAGAGAWRKALAFAGPGYLVAVGYMDPGNWATDLAGGSAYGYALLSVILISSLMAMVLQALSMRLGIATGRDLAQMCRLHYPRSAALALWGLCEIAICACDLAEVIGGAIALNLLFGAPLVLGVSLMAGDALLILLLERRGFRQIEAVAIALIVVVAACFAFEIALARPPLAALAAGLLPRADILRDPGMLYIAIGIIGATVMPHNLYLHSSIVQTRRFARNDAGKRDAARFAGIDTVMALTVALFINAAILMTAAAVFHAHGRTDVAEIQDAYLLLAPMVGLPLASTVFALALLAAGQNATVTATLAGQIAMEGFLELRLPPWLRRLATRLIAIVPAILVVLFSGESGMARLLVLSQVVLSLQLPFALVPLLRFTGNRDIMGSLATPSWLQGLGWVATAVIIVLNLKLLAGLLL